MYNTKVKRDYIENGNYGSNQQFDKVMTNYFERAEDSERRAEKDLALFTTREIRAMYKSFLTPSLDMLVVINNQFLNYTNWYMKEVGTTDHLNHYTEMRDDILMKCVSYAAQKSTVITREELLEMVKEFQNPYESFLYLALYEGIKGEQMSDFFDLSMKDFDGKNYTVTLPGRTLSISRELYHYAEESADEYVIYTITGEPTKKGRFLEDDKRIIKCSASSGFETRKRDRATIVYRMIQKSKRYDFVPINLSTTSLIESGRINMINEIMEENDITNPDQAIRNYREVIETRYGHIPSIPKWILKYGEFCKR